MNSLKRADEIAGLGAVLKRDGLFSDLFDSLEISYKGWAGSTFYFLRCKCSTSHSIIFETTPMMQFNCCGCGIHKQGNSWLDLIKALRPDLTHEQIILSAESLIQKDLEDYKAKKAMTEKQALDYGIYQFPKANIPKTTPKKRVTKSAKAKK